MGDAGRGLTPRRPCIPFRSVDVNPRNSIRTWQRMCALVGALLVLGLGVFASSPSWHGSLHAGHAHAVGDHGCAVDLFAGGVDLPVDVPSRLLAPAPAVEGRSTLVTERRVGSPRYRLLPGRGPPLA